MKLPGVHFRLKPCLVLAQSALLFLSLTLGRSAAEALAGNSSAVPLAPDSPELKSALELWLAADALPLKDGAQVYRWPDQSSYRRDASPTAGVYEGAGAPPTFKK